jgi:hypothetical protein
LYYAASVATKVEFSPAFPPIGFSPVPPGTQISGQVMLGRSTSKSAARITVGQQTGNNPNLSTLSVRDFAVRQFQRHASIGDKVKSLSPSSSIDRSFFWKVVTQALKMRTNDKCRQAHQD